VIHVISLGAGVQSSTMALMAARGEITPMPHCAIFADTGAEPEEVYVWLDWLEKQLPYPVIRVQYKNLRDQIGMSRPKGKFKKLPIPAFIKLASGKGGGLLVRQCTSDYKIIPVMREVRKQLGIFKKKTPEGVLAKQWIGISTDEYIRVKPSRESYSENRWPLIELEMTRGHCIEWMQKNYGVTPPRSACTFCPFHDNKEWRHIKENYPDDFADAIVIDNMIRNLWADQDRPAEFFLHKSMKPLEDADLQYEEENQFDLFNNECEGMCGV